MSEREANGPVSSDMSDGRWNVVMRSCHDTGRVDDRVAETSAGCRSVTSGCRSELALNSRNNGNIDECWFLRESVGERGGGSGTAARNDSLKNPWGLPGLEVADDDVRDREVMFVESSMLELVPCRRLAGL